MKKILSIVICLSILFFACSCEKNSSKKEYSFFGMDTLMTVSVYSDGTLSSDEVYEKAKDITEKLEGVFSATDENAEVYKFNARKESAFSVSDTLKDAVLKSKYAYTLTDGAFDITVMPLLSLWGFDNGNYGVPKSADIKSALSLTGDELLTLNENTLIAKSGVKISLGGIAKGYLGDEIIKSLEGCGVSAVFSLGGNIVTVGSKPDGSLWRVAVKDPLNETENFCTVSVGENTSVVTSGGYERYFEFEGETYHHILDPKTGYPSQSGVLSVTVIGSDGALCDALSTGIFVSGAKKAAQITPDGFDYVILCSDGTIHTTLSETSLEITSDKYKVIR